MLDRAYMAANSPTQRAGVLASISTMTDTEIAVLATSSNVHSVHRSVRAVVLGMHLRRRPIRLGNYIPDSNYRGEAPDAYVAQILKGAADGEHSDYLLCQKPGAIDEHFRQRLSDGDVWSTAWSDFVSDNWFQRLLQLKVDEQVAHQQWVQFLPKDEFGDYDPFYDDSTNSCARAAFAAYVKAWNARINYENEAKPCRTCNGTGQVPQIEVDRWNWCPRCRTGR